RIGARRDHALVGRYRDGRRGVGVLAVDASDETEAEDEQYIAGHDAAERYVGPAEPEVERRYDQQSDEPERSAEHEEALQRTRLRARPALHAARQQGPVPAHQVPRDDGGQTVEERQVDPGLPD